MWGILSGTYGILHFPFSWFMLPAPETLLLQATLLFVSLKAVPQLLMPSTPKQMLPIPGADSMSLLTMLCHRSAVCHPCRDYNAICCHCESYWHQCSWCLIYSSFSFHSSLIGTVSLTAQPKEVASEYNLNDNIRHHQNPLSFKTLVLLAKFMSWCSLSLDWVPSKRGFFFPIGNKVDLQSCIHVPSCLYWRHCWVTIIYSLIHSTNTIEHLSRDPTECNGRKWIQW